MSKENIDRIREGNELLRDHLEKAEEQTQLFLAALKGFRRDLALSLQACSQYIRAEFIGTTALLAVPALEGGRSFSDLADMLALATAAIDGWIMLKNPHPGREDEREKVLAEVEIAHKNLMEIADTAHRLYECIQTACFEFDVFNTKNIEVGYPEANILFDRDALNVSMGTARALGERAVRLDIDLVESRKRLEFSQAQK